MTRFIQHARSDGPGFFFCALLVVATFLF